MESITLEEFFHSKEHMVIHCDTEEKADNLLKAFAAMGKRWNNGASYLCYNNYESYMKQTCYSNDGLYCYYEFYKKYGYIIYEYEDIDDILLKE